MPEELILKIKEIIPRTYNVKSFRVGIDNADFKAGQFICVTVKPGEPCSVYRFLSISSSPTEKGYIEFTKKISQSDFSKALDSLKPGDSVKIQLPARGNFTLNEADKKIAFLSGGIGITPIRSICKYAVDKTLGTDISLVYANATIRDIVFKDDFDLMQKQYANLKVAHVLCEPAPGFKCTIGLINAQVIKNEVPDYPERKFYLCGPPAMVVAMEKILVEELNIAQKDIVTERFQGY